MLLLICCTGIKLYLLPSIREFKRLFNIETHRSPIWIIIFIRWMSNELHTKPIWFRCYGFLRLYSETLESFLACRLVRHLLISRTIAFLIGAYSSFDLKRGPELFWIIASIHRFREYSWPSSSRTYMLSTCAKNADTLTGLMIQFSYDAYIWVIKGTLASNP